MCNNIPSFHSNWSSLLKDAVLHFNVKGGHIAKTLIHSLKYYLKNIKISSFFGRYPTVK